MRRWIQPKYFETLVLTVMKPSRPHARAAPAANGRREAIPTWTIYDSFLMRKSGPPQSYQHQLIPSTCRVHICKSFTYSPNWVFFSHSLHSSFVTIGTCISRISAFGRAPILFSVLVRPHPGIQAVPAVWTATRYNNCKTGHLHLRSVAKLANWQAVKSGNCKTG